MVTSYLKALDIGAQRTAASDIQKLLLDETPVIFSYFPDLLVPVRKNVSGLPPIAAGLLLDRVSWIEAGLDIPLSGGEAIQLAGLRRAMGGRRRAARCQGNPPPGNPLRHTIRSRFISLCANAR